MGREPADPWPWYKDYMSTTELNEKDLPQVKRERIPGTKVDMIKIKDSKGKEHDAREESFSEKEIPNTHLTQIAPMFYYCTDNNKILMIPFSIQFTVYEFLKQAATMSHNMEAILKDLQQKNETASPEDPKTPAESKKKD